MPLPPPTDDLASNPCRTLCEWRPTRAVASDGGTLFACSGCGSQWRPGLGWTPADRDGSVPAEVLDALRAAAPTEPSAARSSASGS